MEPRWDSSCNQKASKFSELWPVPQVVSVSGGAVSLSNDSLEPVIIKKSEHICKIQPQIEGDIEVLLQSSVLPPQTIRKPPVKTSDYSASVSLNPDKILSSSHEKAFRSLMKTYDEAFSPVTSTYNGDLGKCFVEVNMGESLPPQRKGRVPFYSRDNLQELQDKFDELEAKGVFSRPQDIGVTVENTNPSFLVNKQGTSDKRLVTDFSSISEYCRPTPSLLSDVETTLRNIGSWLYIIKLDMTSAYHQMKLKKASQKYCGVHTPYKGLRVYNVGCMGLPGVEVALEELTCLLVGDLVKEGKVAKLADDLFVGGATPEELLENFEKVLYRMIEGNVKLSPAKTTIAPKSLTVLGWIWSSGQLRASPHRISSLSSCKPPETVSSMKSFIGAYRFLSRVLPGYAKVLMPLESSIKGKSGKEKLIWSTSLRDSFLKAQQSLMNAKVITVPKPSDTLWIVTDAAIRPLAIGATLYAVRNGKPHLAGFFNSKLPDFQTRWLPCEVEGLAVASALNHWSPFIIENKEKPQVLTDSKACVQAVQKLRRGEFSASARLTAFLSGISRYNAQIQHISGAVNLPSDHASRNPLVCSSPDSCHVCKFISEASAGVVNEVSITDFIEGRTPLPFTNRAAWKDIQSECPDLRKVLSHKKAGTDPNKKSRNLRTVRKFLSAKLVIAPDGLLVHRLIKPLMVTDQIVVPEQVAVGFLTALHLKLNHPTAYQLSKSVSRYFFMLKLDEKVEEVSKSCHHCASIRDIPKSLIKQSTSEPVSAVGSKYVGDIIKRSNQNIFIMRETTTSLTLAEHIPNETVKEVTDVIIKLSNIVKPSKLSSITVKLDPSSAHKSMFQKLSQGSELAENNISLELGRALNVNKNPIIDKGIRELNREILNIKPTGGPLSPLELSKAVACLNGRLRSSGMSAYELWTQRDQVTGEQLPIVDRDLIINQHNRRLANHPFSEKSKSGGKPARQPPNLTIGTLVYVFSDRDKTAARPRYIVSGFSDSGLIQLRRFTSKLLNRKVYDVSPDNIYKVPEYYPADLPRVEEEVSSDEDMYDEISDAKKENRRVSKGQEFSDEDGDRTSTASGSTEGQLPTRSKVQHSPPHPQPPAELVLPEVIGETGDSSRRLRRRRSINYCEDSPPQGQHSGEVDPAEEGRHPDHSSRRLRRRRSIDYCEDNDD